MFTLITHSKQRYKITCDLYINHAMPPASPPHSHPDRFPVPIGPMQPWLLCLWLNVATCKSTLASRKRRGNDTSYSHKIVRLSSRPFTHPSVRLPVPLFFSPCLSPSIHPTHPSIHPYVPSYMRTYVRTDRQTDNQLCVRPSIHPTIYPSVGYSSIHVLSNHEFECSNVKSLFFNVTILTETIISAYFLNNNHVWFKWNSIFCQNVT